MFSITFLQNDAMDNFVNAHNGLALPEFGPFSILKNTHVVLKLWRIFGFKDRRNILSKTTTFHFCIGYNSITFFKTCQTQCTVGPTRVFTLGFLSNCIWVCEFLHSYFMSDWDRRKRKGHQKHGLIWLQKSRISQYFSYLILSFRLEYNMPHIIVCGKYKTPKV